jgi:hypothetical protein
MNRSTNRIRIVFASFLFSTFHGLLTQQDSLLIRQKDPTIRAVPEHDLGHDLATPCFESGGVTFTLFSVILLCDLKVRLGRDPNGIQTRVTAVKGRNM